jgi:undecaprenyl diphosphate synthase
MNYKELINKLDKSKMPRHIAIIMDGNGRWAEKHKTKRINGHKEGVKAVRRIVETAVEAKLEYLTIYAFSTENWRRSQTEVSYLLKLIMDSLVKEIDELIKNNVNIRFIGSREKLEESYNKRVMETCKKSWENTDLHLNVAMNYGGRKELLDAFNAILVDAPGMPEVDMVIRTSGEERLSNFLIWQSAYAEFWFTQTLWPDFSREEFIQAMLDFQQRKRRFGTR